MDGAGWYRFGLVSEQSVHEINVMILVIIFNNAAVLNTRTACTVHNTGVVRQCCTMKVGRPMQDNSCRNTAPEFPLLVHMI
jgi:hypothetical protein